MELIRSFVAIEINDEIRQKIINGQNKLKQVDADVKWVSPENIHLTLKFLGEIERMKLDKIKELLGKELPGFGGFNLEFEGIGSFERKGQLSIIWIGCKGDLEALERLFQIVEKCTVKVGIETERRGFSPHVTIGRVRSKRNQTNLISRIKEVACINFGTQQVKETTLFKSTLLPSGPIYSVIETFKL